MLPIDGRPVLERELTLREQGVTGCAHHSGASGPGHHGVLGDARMLAADGRPFGVHIEYFVEKEPL